MTKDPPAADPPEPKEPKPDFSEIPGFYDALKTIIDAPKGDSPFGKPKKKDKKRKWS
jgi:hypothetical protein